MVNNENEPPRLRGWFTMSLGLLALVIGGVWTLQGLGYLGDGLMSGETFWAAAGGALVVAGLALVVAGMRRRSSTQSS